MPRSTWRVPAGDPTSFPASSFPTELARGLRGFVASVAAVGAPGATVVYLD
jgi:hypothetical protein